MEDGKELVGSYEYDKELEKSICKELDTVAGKPIVIRSTLEETQPEEDICREIGKTVLQLRYFRDVTQKKLAEETDLSLEEIIDIEYGAANPTVDTLNRIANALGTKLIIGFVDP